MSDETYEGWTNRETWAVALWINNEQGLQEQTLDTLRDYFRDIGTEDKDSRAGEIVQEIIDELFDPDTYDGKVPAGVVTMMRDIGSLWRVNWDELGASFLADLAEQDAYNNG